jgi:arylsulfatase A-like enzyme
MQTIGLQTGNLRQITLGVFIMLSLSACSSVEFRRKDSGEKPNIIFVLADDLGYAELGVYGQQKIKTPHLDRLAREGMRFTQFYSGSPVCAPSRCAFLTGKHTGHAYVRDNMELGGFKDSEERGQLPLPANEPNLAKWLKREGYATALVGKWGLGGPESASIPTKQGFDFFYGYLDQKQAHNYYPSHLWRNERWEKLNNAYFSPHQKLEVNPNTPHAYDAYKGKQYAIDLMTREALRFIEENRQRPFFLYYAPTLPHVALQVPDEALRAYLGKFLEEAYLGEQGYLPHPTPRAAYAAMISYLDGQVGKLLDELKSLQIDQNTLVIFTSDNGATFSVGGPDVKFFDSLDGLRGSKGDVYEGGIRVPFIARWPGHVASGTTSDHIGANWDIWATFAELLGKEVPSQTDGLSILPTLLGTGKQREHEYLYWEFPSRGGQQAVRVGRWKGVRTGVGEDLDASIQLYDLVSDVSESKDVASLHPEITKRMVSILREAHVPSPVAKFNFLDQ